MADRELEGLRALVTGASKGIGHAVAARLSEQGATVLATARTMPNDLPGGGHSDRTARETGGGRGSRGVSRISPRRVRYGHRIRDRRRHRTDSLTRQRGFPFAVPLFNFDW